MTDIERLKVEIFELLREQAKLQQRVQEIEQTKQSKLQELTKLESPKKTE